MEKTPESPLEMLQRLQRQHAEKACAEGRAWPGREEVAGAGWIARRTVANRPLVTALRERLDPGEAETIALAVECQPPFVLMDEKEGRHAAQRFGLKTVGVVGVLLEAKARGLIGPVGPLGGGLLTERPSDRVFRTGFQDFKPHECLTATPVAKHLFCDIPQSTELDVHCRYLGYNVAQIPQEDHPMSENTVVRARIDEHIKEEASTVLAAMGLTVSDAFRILLTRIAREKALPFEPLVPNETTIAAMREARAGNLKSFDSVEALMADLHAKD